MSLVLDSGAVVAWLDEESGADIVSARLSAAIAASEPIYIHAVNLCDVYYGYSRNLGALGASEILSDLIAQGIESYENVDKALMMDAGQLKADWARVSLADCFGLALARRLNAEFLTADRHELERFQAAGIANITFIR